MGKGKGSWLGYKRRRGKLSVVYLFTHESHLLLPLVPDAFGRLPVGCPPAFNTKSCHAKSSTSNSETQAGHQTKSGCLTKLMNTMRQSVCRLDTAE